MLRWFRKYNKFILVIGCAVLMVAFLIPQAVQMFSPVPGDRTVATVDGESVTMTELADAGNRLEVLSRLGLGPLTPYEREQWFLLLRDAEAAGLGASDVEVSQALAAVGVDPTTERLAEVAASFGQQPEAIRAVIRDLLVAERYRLLASGHRFDSNDGSLFSSPGLVSIAMLNQTRSFLGGEQAQQLGPALLQQVQFRFQNSLEGTGRLSPPFVAAVLFDEAERVGGSLAVIDPEVTDEVRAGLTDGDLQRLFTEYSDFLPGRGAPYPFGYRVPDRVKLEALSVPREAVRATIDVGTVDVLEAFRKENPGVTPTEEQREETRQRLIDEAAAAKLREVASLLRGELEAARRGVSVDAAGRLELAGSAYQSPPMEALADEVEAAHGVRPTILRRTDDFVAVDEAGVLGDLAFAGLPDLRLRFADLLRELPELRPAAAGQAVEPADEADAEGDSADAEPGEPAPDESPVAVQVGVAMPLLTGLLDGSLHVVRVTAADPTHPPASLDEVRDEVNSDAALVAAYERLLERKGELLQEAAAGGLEALTRAKTVVEVPPFPRRTRQNSPDGRPVAPPLPEVGRAAALVDAAFAVVEGLEAGQAADALPMERRMVAEGVDGRLALGVFRIDELQRPTRSDLGREVASGLLTGLDQVLLGTEDQNPLEADALRERLKYAEEG